MVFIVQHVLSNALIFLAFYAVALLHHFLFARSVGVDAHIKASFFATAANPALHDAARDFAAHLVVYSGYILPAHP